MDAQTLGRALYEAEAAVAAASLPPGSKVATWEELPKHAQQRRVAQAERLLQRFDVEPRMDKHEIAP